MTHCKHMTEQELKTTAHVNLMPILEMMRRHGGDFARHLARAWQFADSHNSRLLQVTFIDLLLDYRDYL